MVLSKNTEAFILAWLDFDAGDSILCVEEQTKSYSSYLAEKGLSVISVSIRESAKDAFIQEKQGKFDYVIAIGVLERCFTPELVLPKWTALLKNDGSLLLATPNRLGIQFFCGDRDPFTKNIFDSIENYSRQPNPLPKNMGGKLYARSEVESMLARAGFARSKFYSVYPNLSVPQLLYADDYLPNENLNLRVLPRYNDNSTVFMDERCLYDGLVQNGLFHKMANAFFIECPKESSNFSSIKHVTLPVFRDQEAFATIIKNNGVVEKRLLDESGKDKLAKMAEIDSDLQRHGINTVGFDVKDNSLEMPYVDAPSAAYYLRDLLLHDKDKFISELDKFVDLIVNSSEHVSGEGYDAVLKRGYMDLVPINAFYKDGNFVFYDQEFYYENLPAKVIIWRSVAFVYDNSSLCNSIIPCQFFFDRYKIDNVEQILNDYIKPFMDKLLNKDFFSDFNSKTALDYDIVSRNYRIINNGFSELLDGPLLLSTCFENIGGKKIVVFGAGKYADKFLAFYKDDYDIECIVDNNAEKHGSLLRGVRVSSPDVLYGLNPNDYKVVICMKDFKAVYLQLRSLGVRNIGLYDANYIYPGRQSLVPSLMASNKSQPHKKYHIGYIAGVFDLYHLGHLNMFRRAKEQCDYLIVGVTSDRYVVERKQREPFIPFEERLELVRYCKYVDEAHEIPFEYGGTVEAFQKYHFDVQFSGSDYVNHPWWLEQQKWLREHGADLVFFPYTEQTSSTKIKALIEKGLL